MRRSLSLILAMLMLFSVLPATAESGTDCVQYQGPGIIWWENVKTSEEELGGAPSQIASVFTRAYLMADDFCLVVGKPIVFTPVVVGGTAPYSFSITSYRRELGSTENKYYGGNPVETAESTTGSCEISYTLMKNGEYFFRTTVVDSEGNKAQFDSSGFNCYDATATADNKALTNKVRQIVAEVVQPGMNDYEKALALHDWLVTHASYDYTYTWYLPEGVLLHGTGVCQSYGLAYQLLMQAVGIECVYVKGRGSGESHGWNVIKINGNWYQVDCTWDSNSYEYGYDYHDYFCLTDEEMALDHQWNS